MGFPDYIHRAETSASQVLHGFRPDTFRRTLSEQVVGIAFDANAAGTDEGRATLDLSVRLLSRLHPTLAIAPLGKGTKAVASGLEALARSINPNMDVLRGIAKATCLIAVGRTAPRFAGPTWYVGSDGWLTLLRRNAPAGSGATGNPFGAGFAACLAAANVFRHVFKDGLIKGESDDDVAFSTFRYGANCETDDPPLSAMEIGQTYLVGVGAIGNGAVWALSRTTGLTGRLDLVDPESVDLSNLQRYVLTTRADVERVKVDLAAAAFEGTGLRIVTHPTNFAKVVSSSGTRTFERVAVTLDNAADRVAVQGALPKWIANAWTQPDDLGVSRHGAFGREACLACLYMPSGPTRNEDQIVCDELRMPEALMRVRLLLHSGAPVGETFVRDVARALGIAPEPLLHLADRPLPDFRSQAICGGLVMRLSEGNLAAPAEVPMPFQSALAGIMLAADLVKHSAGLLRMPTACTRINLLRPLGSHLHDPVARDSSGRCICADSDFLDAYRRKYAPSLSVRL